MVKIFGFTIGGKTSKNLGANSNKTKKAKNSNSKKTKRTKNSVLYKKGDNQKFRPIKSNKVFHKEEFDEIYGNTQPRFKKILKADVVIMYDIDAPNGEGEKGNITYIHYLEVKGKVIIPYQPPNPFQGIHNYYSISIRLHDKNTLKKLESLTETDRKASIIQNLHKDTLIDDFIITKENIMRLSNFKVSAEKVPKKVGNNSKNKGNNTRNQRNRNRNNKNRNKSSSTNY